VNISGFLNRGAPDIDRVFYIAVISGFENRAVVSRNRGFTEIFFTLSVFLLMKSKRMCKDEGYVERSGLHLIL
jgi:hypothetical protein